MGSVADTNKVRLLIDQYKSTVDEKTWGYWRRVLLVPVAMAIVLTVILIEGALAWPVIVYLARAVLWGGTGVWLAEHLPQLEDQSVMFPRSVMVRDAGVALAVLWLLWAFWAGRGWMPEDVAVVSAGLGIAYFFDLRIVGQFLEAFLSMLAGQEAGTGQARANLMLRVNRVLRAADTFSLALCMVAAVAGAAELARILSVNEKPAGSAMALRIVVCCWVILCPIDAWLASAEIGGDLGSGAALRLRRRIAWVFWLLTLGSVLAAVSFFQHGQDAGGIAVPLGEPGPASGERPGSSPADVVQRASAAEIFGVCMAVVAGSLALFVAVPEFFRGVGRLARAALGRA